MNWRENYQPELVTEINDLGCKLSIAIDCIVHKIAPGVPAFECKCGVMFPVYLLKQENWAAIKRRHDEEMKYAGHT